MIQDFVREAEDSTKIIPRRPEAAVLNAEVHLCHVSKYRISNKRSISHSGCDAELRVS